VGPLVLVLRCIPSHTSDPRLMRDAGVRIPLEPRATLLRPLPDHLKTCPWVGAVSGAVFFANYRTAARLPPILLECDIQSGTAMPSRCRPPAHADAQATTAPSSVAAATENARMIAL
jgi:hypothetical protein